TRVAGPVGAARFTFIDWAAPPSTGASDSAASSSEMPAITAARPILVLVLIEPPSLLFSATRRGRVVRSAAPTAGRPSPAGRGPGRPGALPDDQLRLGGPRAGGGRGPRVEQAAEQPEGRPAETGEVEAHGRERGREEPGQRDVVEPDHADVAGDLP